MEKFGNCEIIEKLHVTKYTEIYKVRHPENKLTLILKALKDEFPSPELVTRIKTEYQIISQIDSPFTIKAHSIEKEGNRYGIVIEDIEGISLREYYSGKLELAEFYKIAILMVNAIGDVHKSNIIHKDINPSNFIYNSKTNVLKIIDFGISTTFSKENTMLENLNVLEGTLAYISPEQTGRMNRSMDYRTDYYSLGITFYQLLTGKLPFDFTDPMELVHSHIARQANTPFTLDSTIPIPLSDLVMKLISKTAEGRYLSCHGLKFDLDALASAITDYSDIFPKLGTNDISEKFQIPQKLYGREKEIQTLLSAFENVNQVNDDISSAFMLVSGYSGIGKSSLVAEIYKPITERRGFFISGKFDQFQRNIPYSAVVNAFKGLTRQLLTESEASLQIWKTKLLESFDTKGQVVADVIPEIELIVGKQSLVPELPPVESRNRFNMVFQNFIRVFCSKEHPLVIFLDDLQWADSATLKLIELILTDKEIKYLFLIGAYRDNEVNATHPFIMMLDELKKNHGLIQELKLSPLVAQHIEQIVADTLHSTVTHIRPIAKLIEEKTGGNPFFVNEFLKTLYSENLLLFDNSDSERQIQISPWKWNIELIRSKGLTDNVVELLVGNLRKLSDIAQDILQLSACVGARFDLKTLSIISELPETQIFEDLSEPILLGFVLPMSKFNADCIIMDYRFAHDRVLQAAYSLIDESSKKYFHLKIGRLLLANTHPDLIEENIFDIVNQLNQALDAIDEPLEKTALAELNLIAGRKAKASAAYGPAVQYLNIGLGLIANDGWECHYALNLALHEEAATAFYLNGNFTDMEKKVIEVRNNAKNQFDQVQVYEIKIQACIAQSKLREAVQIVLQAVSILGLNISEKFIEQNTIAIRKETAAKLVGKSILDLSKIPNMSDKRILVIMRLLGSANAAAYTGMPDLLPFIVCQEVNLSIDYGNSPVTALAYAYYGAILCGDVESIHDGFQFGEAALKILEKFDDQQINAKTIDMVYGMIKGWKVHLKETLKPLQENYQVARDHGTFDYAGYSILKHCYYCFLIGQPLKNLEQKLMAYIQDLTQVKQFTAVNYLERDRQVVLNLIEGSERPGFITGKIYNEAERLPLYIQAGDQYGLLYFFLSKLILSFLFEDMETAIYSANMAESNLAGGTGLALVAAYYFYDSLVRLAVYSTKENKEQELCLLKIKNNQAKMQHWVQHAPMNFQHKYDLVAAEMARVLGDFLTAMEYYDKAITAAKINDYINDEAIANELCGSFWLGMGKEEFAQLYIRKAHYAYTVWGATAKAKFLEKKYPTLVSKIKEIDQGFFNAGTIMTRTTPQKTEANLSLDFVSIMKASQIISGEIILDKLLTSLMKILVENAGAEKGFLLLEINENLCIETAWNSDSNLIDKSQTFLTENSQLLSPSVVNYVSRTKQDLVIDDVSGDGRFKDSYITKNRPKSVLCIPLLNQGKLTGIVYLENDLTTGAFTKDRIEVLKMLSSQAAISIENARLYSNLENITKEKTRVTTEMEIARDIQTSLLPTKPTLTEFDVATYMFTADSVGGDYYDVIHTDGREWFVIGDVSGHGVTAGLIMMMTQTAIHTILNSVDTKNPADLLRKVNLVITSNIKKMKLSKYMTLTLFLKEADGVIYYSGMHQDLLLYIAKTKNVEMIETRGSWIGYYDLHNEYEVDKIKMERGDVLLLFTDGITEAINEREEMYDINGLVKLLKESGTLSTEEIKKRILLSLQDFNTDDDVTFMICKRN